MLSVGRKFLLASKGGLNLPHSKDAKALVSRHGERSVPLTTAFGLNEVRA